MPDDKRRNTPDDDEQPNISPSALFLEMMREAARHAENEPLIPLTMDDETPVNDTDALPDELAAAFDTHFPQVEPNSIIETEPVITSPSVEVALDEARSKPAEVPESTPIAESRVPIYDPPRTEDTISPEDRAVLLEAQRVRRVRRRQERARQRQVGIMGGFLRTVFITVFSAALASTVFTWFTAPEFITPGVASDLQVADATSIAAAAPVQATSIPITPNFMQRVGIVSGHRGPENDPGAVCDDGLTEAEINFSVAQIVVRTLRSRGYTVELLDEFDPRLESFQGAALVSLHSNDCRDYGEYVSGYLVARAAARPAGGFDDVLAECIALHYGRSTLIERRFALTLDMTDYHTFREIHSLTPAAILEMGFMKDDRALLTGQQDKIAEGIINGILCFLNGEDPLPQLTAPPVALPTEGG